MIDLLTLDERETREHVWRERVRRARYVRSHSAATRASCKLANERENAAYLREQELVRRAFAARRHGAKGPYYTALRVALSDWRCGRLYRSTQEHASASAALRVRTLRAWDTYRAQLHALNLAEDAAMRALLNTHLDALARIEARLLDEERAALARYEHEHAPGGAPQ